jgi:capsular polysaccharide transport system permease protein
MPRRQTAGGGGGVARPPLSPRDWSAGPGPGEPAPAQPRPRGGANKAEGPAKAQDPVEAPVLEPQSRPAARPAPRGLTDAMNAHLERFDLRMPQHHGAPPIFATAWFIIAFVIPMLVGITYYGLVASKQYVSEFHFTVRQPLPDSQPTSPSGGQNDFLGLLGRSASASGSADTLDNYTVVDYIRSDQAARDLDQRLHLRALFTRAGVDPISRYGGARQPERLAEYWRRMVWATYDPATGLASVKVRAFSPADAYAIATNLIDLSNDVVNSNGRRSRADSLRVAQQEVDGVERRMGEIRNRLTALRNQIGAIDPTKDEVAGNVELSNTLRGTLTQLEAQLGFLSGQLHSPDAPQLAKVKAEISATQAQLAGVDSRVNHNHTGNVALTSAVGEFEQLDAERQAVEQILFRSLDQLQLASVGADSQRLYLATYVEPATPESSTYPRRLEAIAILAMACLMIWAIGVLFGKSVMDHIR